ncbi:MAG: glycosyltransferase family 9 protein [Bacteroidia bacterium]|nr:glycosyltransferase family 9 protein [Bacteroidia bacterium]
MKKNHTQDIKMKRILVLRFSSMGDVLLTLPAMVGILNSNTDLELVFITRKKFAPYFAGIDRLIVIPFDPRGNHKGLPGIFRLFREIRHYRFKKAVDLHGVLRTHLLDILLLFTGCQIYRIRKHRKLRRYILKHKKPGMSVPNTVDRYMSVFGKAGLAGEISANAFPVANETSGQARIKTGVFRAGIAPVSKHTTKNWGLKNVARLISLLNLKYPVEIHLFGGPEDHAGMESLSGPNVFNHAGAINPAEEISLIRTLDVFITMDSANMHLASLAGIPTVSIWGATDPRLGFAPIYQPDDYAIHADPSEVICRPCSVYGEIPCKRSDSPMICMNSIKPEQVFDKIYKILHVSKRY